MFAIPRIGIVVLAACLTAAVATPQGKGGGNGNGNGNGGGGGDDGGDGGASALYAPVLIINGQRRDLEENVSAAVDVFTGTFWQPQQIRPDSGKDRAPIYSVSSRGDLSMRQADGTRYVVDVRVSGSAPWAMVCMPETAATHANPTWWYVPAEDDPVDVVLAPDLTGWTIFDVRWSHDLEWIAVHGTNPAGVSGIFLWDIALVGGVPVGAIVDTLPYVENAAGPSWGAGQRLAFARDDDLNGFAEVYVAQDLAGKVFVLITDQATRLGSTQLRWLGKTFALSPDGTQVAYGKLTPAKLPEVGRTDLFVLPADGSGSEASALRVTDMDRVKPKGFWTREKIDHPVWDPAGTQLAFSLGATANNVRETWRITVLGTTQAKKLTSDLKFNGNVTGEAIPVAWRD